MRIQCDKGFDCYDSHTIALLQGISGRDIVSTLDFDLYKIIGIRRNAIKYLIVQEKIDSDEMKELLINRFPVPKHVTCDVCGLPMRLCIYIKDIDAEPGLICV